MINPLAKALLFAAGFALILYALIPPAEQPSDDTPYNVDLAVPPGTPSSDSASTTDLAPTGTDAPTAPDSQLQFESEAPATQEDTAELEDSGGSPEETASVDTETETSGEQPLSVEETTDTTGTQPLQQQPETAGSDEEMEPLDSTSEPSSGQDEDTAALDESQDSHTEESVPAGDGWITREIQSGDTLAKIFQENDLSPSLLAELLNCGTAAKSLEDIRPGQSLSLRFDTEGNLKELVHERSSISSLKITANDDGFASELVEKPVEVRTQSASTVIDSSLFENGQRAGLSDKVIMDLADLFNWDIDFARELREGDRFSVIYETAYVDGEKYRDGNILAAEFVNNGKSHRAIRYRDPDGLVEYYAPDGTAKKKAFIKTPVKFSRISSKFTNKRWHPVLKRWRSHKGVDYAAPTGTPIKAAGKGKVSFIGRQQGYGKVIYLQHGEQYTTVYGHLSGFAKGLKKGDTVTQGEIIGYVGQTGLATGPHLHYEFRVNGKHVDPLSTKLPTAMPLPKQYMADFKRYAEPLVAQLNLLASPKVADHP